MNKSNLTKNDIISIMDMYRSDMDSRDIANKMGVSQGYISNIARAYNGSLKKLNLLSKDIQNIIKEVSPFYLNKDNNTQVTIRQNYTCKLFFGLITLKIEPEN